MQKNFLKLHHLTRTQVRNQRKEARIDKQFQDKQEATVITLRHTRLRLNPLQKTLIYFTPGTVDSKKSRRFNHEW